MRRNPPIRSFLCLAALAGAVLGIAFSPALAQSKPARDTYTLEDLKRVEKARDDALARLNRLKTSASKVDREAAAIDADLIAAAADSSRREETAADAERRLAELDIEMKAARSHLTGDEATREDLLAALMTFNSRKPPALAASPKATSDAVRAAILMSEAAPALTRRAEDLRQTLADLSGLTQEAQQQREALATAEQALAARRQEIEALSAEKRLARASLAAETAALTVEADKLAQEADTLRDLLDSLSRAAPTRPGVKPKPGAKPPSKAAAPPAAAKPRAPSTDQSGLEAPRAAGSAGKPVPPAVGQKIRRFGQVTDLGRSQGVVLATRSGAQVVAPADARIEYAGQFRTYGQMLILDVGSDMLVIVSGLDALYPETGQWVLAGEPIGRMTEKAGAELYFEVRKNGQPVDPEAWLAGRK